MAVEIDIDGNRVTLNDVATEETLRRVVDAIEPVSYTHLTLPTTPYV